MSNQIKKVFTLVLTFCLLLSISCVAFADSFTDGNPTTRSLAHCEPNTNRMETIEMSADTSVFMSTIPAQFVGSSPILSLALSPLGEYVLFDMP